jgi:DNA polymerase-1
MGRLFDSSLLSYSLDSLAERYLGVSKDEKVLLEAIKEHDLYPWLQKELKRKQCKGVISYTRPTERNWELHKESDIIRWAKKNMKVIQAVAPEAMAQYACKDVDLTWRLFEYFKEAMSPSQLALSLKYSMLAHICIDYRLRGVRIDLGAIREAQHQLGPLTADKKQVCYDEAGTEFNLASSQETGSVLAGRGLSVPRQEKKPTEYSVDAKWLSRQDDILCAHILDYRQYNKIKKDVFDKLLAIQEYTVGPGAYSGQYGRIYPELNILRAKTGRSSSQGPNIQNFPTRHPVLGKMCRSLFIPEEGETFYSLDYSNQEGRLQVHYGVLLDCSGADLIQREFLRDPRFDLHQWVADLCGISRFDGKTINLGISYGMALNTLGQALGVSRSSAGALKKRYNQRMPYLYELSKKSEKRMIESGRIKTLGGRLLRREVGFEYKSLNKLIQGSAADQTIEAMIEAHKRGIPVLFPVHDELCMSTSNPQHAYDLQALMVNAYELEVPTVVDINSGSNWGQCKGDQ